MGIFFTKQDTATDFTEQDSIPGFIFEFGNSCEFITDKNCCICYEDYKNGTLLNMLPCNHILHYPCLKLWYTKNPICPLCMRKFI